MVSMKRVIKYMVCLSVMLGCNTGTGGLVSPDAYLRYMQNADNGLGRQIDVGRSEYVIQLATPEYMLTKEYVDNWSGVADSIKTSRIAELKGHVFILIRIRNKHVSGSVAEGLVEKSKAEQLVMYYHNAAANDITLSCAGKTMQPVVYQFENNYSLVDYNTIVAGFEQAVGQDDISIVFNDRYNGNDFIKAKFSLKDQERIPGLKIK